MGKKQYSTLAAREARLAVFMLIPAFLIVFAIILFPVLLNFWISFKPVRLGDLRPPNPVAREQIVERPSQVGDELVLRYQLRNSSRQDPIRDVRIQGSIPPGLVVSTLPDGFTVDDRVLSAAFDEWAGGYSERVELRFTAEAAFIDSGWLNSGDMTFPVASGRGGNKLFNLTFSGENYRAVLSAGDFWPSLLTTF
ncbi:MAG: sugar ABC transporter permease, partial [Alkalispirochaeta sp.]